MSTLSPVRKLVGINRFLGVFLAAILAGLGCVAVQGSTADAAPATHKINAEDKCSGVGIAGQPHMEYVPIRDFRADMALARSLGADRYRLGVNWREVESTPGQYEWKALDARIDAVVDAGITPMLLLNTEPTWIDRVDVPDHADEFSEFAGAVAERYGSKVMGYEIWNEPNLDYFWKNPSADTYFPYLKGAYQAIHKADSSAIVMNGGPAPAANTSTSVDTYDFLRRLYELGAKDYTDAIGVHPYTYPLLPSSDEKWNSFRVMDRVRAMMKKFGDGDKQFWSTEFGAPTGGLDSVSRDDQAAIVDEAIDTMINDDQWGPVFLYTLRDLDLGVLNRESYFGLLTAKGEPKPVVESISSALSRCDAGGDDGDTPGDSGTPDNEGVIDDGDAIGGGTGSAGGDDFMPSQS